ncbi:MAG: RagB/SusD family nutrient uptake outer membrane protein [Cyclobacteriaceae bacterium]
MKMFNKIIAAIVLVSAIGFACSDEFLDAPAQGVLDSNTLANAYGVEGNLIATYSMLDGWAQFGGWGGAGSNWIFGAVASDNAYKGSEPGDQQPTEDVELMNWTTGGADGYLNDKWANLYEGISRANATLTLLKSDGITDLSDADRSRIEGEAKFLRAHYHFDAWRFWENIPYYTEDDVDFKKSNMGTDAIPLIIADLDAAIGLLPTSQGDVGRATQWTARAYKGRVQVYSGDYSGGLATLRDVVDNGPYALEDCFHHPFSTMQENGPETILAYQASTNDGMPQGENGNRNDRLNFPHGGSPFGCCGFFQPSQNLVNAFKVDASGLPVADFNSADLDPTADAVDPRLDWTVGRDDVPFIDWGLHAPGWIRDRAYAGPYSNKKSIYERSSGSGQAAGSGWADYQLHSLNQHLFRYADAMLLLAEAEVEAGSLENARAIVNEIRTRAGACAQGPDGVAVEVPIDDAGITWANYSVGTYDAAWTDQGAARDAVRKERRLELAMEGHRFFDLRRWGIAEQVINDYVAVEGTKRAYMSASSPYTGRHDRYPIPTAQIEVSRVDGVDMLEQNPGW